MTEKIKDSVEDVNCEANTASYWLLQLNETLPKSHNYTTVCYTLCNKNHS